MDGKGTSCKGAAELFPARRSTCPPASSPPAAALARAAPSPRASGSRRGPGEPAPLPVPPRAGLRAPCAGLRAHRSESSPRAVERKPGWEAVRAELMSRHATRPYRVYKPRGCRGRVSDRHFLPTAGPIRRFLRPGSSWAPNLVALRPGKAQLSPSVPPHLRNGDICRGPMPH